MFEINKESMFTHNSVVPNSLVYTTGRIKLKVDVKN